MFEHDYLMRMIMQLFEAITRSLRAGGEEKDPQAAADLLEGAIGTATEIDGSVLLSLSPDSIASILSVSGTDPRMVEYVARSLYLESHYLDQAGNPDLALLREDQARALADHYGFTLDEDLGAQAAMEAYLANQQQHMQEAGLGLKE